MIKVRSAGTPTLTVILFGILSVCIRPVDSWADFAVDARWAPQHANVLVMINSSRIFESDVAREARAAESSRAAFETGTSIVTPTVDRLLIASQWDFEVMRSLWTSAVYSRARKKFDINEIANRLGSNVDNIANRSTVVLPNDVILVELGPEAVGVMKPGNRQAVARWLKGVAASGSNQLGPYLKKAVSYADGNADIIIAMDLEDALTSSAIRERLGNLSSVESTDIDSVTHILSGIQGITLGVTIRKTVTGSLKIEFVTGAKGLEKIGKSVLIEILENRGMMIDDIADWSVKATDREILLTGPLSSAGLRAINSLVSQPLLPEFTAEPNENDNAPYARSKTYFSSLESYVKELSTKKPEYRTLRTYAAWFETYASKIDEFSILGVDPDLVASGVKVSDGLRQMAQILRQTNSEVKQQKAELKSNSAYVSGYYDRGYEGFYRHNNLTPQRNAIEVAGEGYASTQARDIMQAITTEINTSRRNMSLKYGVDF